MYIFQSLFYFKISTLYLPGKFLVFCLVPDGSAPERKMISIFNQAQELDAETIVGSVEDGETETVEVVIDEDEIIESLPKRRRCSSDENTGELAQGLH